MTYLVSSPNQNKRTQLQYINIRLRESSDFFSACSDDDTQPQMIVSEIPHLL